MSPTPTVFTRWRAATLVVISAALALLSAAPPVGAASPPSDPATAGATWLAAQVGAGGTLEGFTPGQADYGSTLQGIIALAAVGQQPDTARQMLNAVNASADEVVVVAGADDAGRLALLILANVAWGEDPTSVNGIDLVARLQAAQRPTPGADAGLFGAADPTFDGSFRQGLALLALASVGVDDPEGVAWLTGQQCASGAWVAYRSDIGAACPEPDPATFSGPDSNSTAMALMGLTAQGASPTADAAAWLRSIRTPDGGWPYLGSPSEASDASSTGLVLAALRTAEVGPPASTSARVADADSTALLNAVGSDAEGQAALRTFQMGCDADPADIGGFFYQPQPDDSQIPDVFSTNQALWGLADVPFPVVDAQANGLAIEACPVVLPTTTTGPGTTVAPTSTAITTTTTTTSGGIAPAADSASTTTAAPTTSPPAVAGATATTAPTVAVAVAGATQTAEPGAAGELARTGSSPGALAAAAAVLMGLGGALLALRRRGAPR